MFKLDLTIWKSINPNYTRYCGHDMLCIEGEQTVLSVVLWLIIAGGLISLGAYLQRRFE